jgi:hypothetical protein
MLLYLEPRMRANVLQDRCHPVSLRHGTGSLEGS